VKFIFAGKLLNAHKIKRNSKQTNINHFCFPIVNSESEGLIHQTFPQNVLTPKKKLDQISIEYYNDKACYQNT